MSFYPAWNCWTLPDDRIPQLSEVDEVLEPATGWKTAAVPALIGFDRFFELLSQRRFPVATFIRSRKDLDYIKEPDIFHEIFGHCAMLTNRHFADFTAHYGKLGVSATPSGKGLSGPFVLVYRGVWSGASR